MTSMNCRDRCHVCHRTSHQHYQDFHPEKWEINNTKRKYFLSPFRLLSNGTFLKGIVNSKTCLALNLMSLIVMKVTGVPNTSKADLGGKINTKD